MEKDTIEVDCFSVRQIALSLAIDSCGKGSGTPAEMVVEAAKLFQRFLTDKEPVEKAE